MATESTVGILFPAAMGAILPDSYRIHSESFIESGAAPVAKGVERARRQLHRENW
jgi:hypothetical protein